MRATLIAAAIALLFATSAADADQRVKGYTKKNGTYVAPHYRSSANGVKFDNYTTKGNTNPYTGQKGYKDPYAPKHSARGK